MLAGKDVMRGWGSEPTTGVLISSKILEPAKPGGRLGFQVKGDGRPSGPKERLGHEVTTETSFVFHSLMSFSSFVPETAQTFGLRR